LQLPRLILITDSSRMLRGRFFEAVDAALTGGVDAVLVREKQMDSARLLAFCARLRSMTRSHAASLIIHSQADVAKAVGADGVHVSAGDMGDIPAIRAWMNHPGLSISASCHNKSELDRAARSGADFVLLSPVFPTPSHPGAPHLGVARFQRLAENAALPVIALGGITQKNRQTLAACGVAVISAILDADNPGNAARHLKKGSG